MYQLPGLHAVTLGRYVRPFFYPPLRRAPPALQPTIRAPSTSNHPRIYSSSLATPTRAPMTEERLGFLHFARMPADPKHEAYMPPRRPGCCLIPFASQLLS